MTRFRGTDFQSVRAGTLIGILVLATVSRAESPDVKALYPAGIQRGAMADVRVVGKLGSRPVEVWTSTDALTVTVPDEGDVISVAAKKDCPLGVHWIRLHNADGASSLRPFAVGTLPEIVESETNDFVEKANPVDGSGVVANGVLAKSGDVDAWSVDLRRGQTFVAVASAHHDLGSPMDAVLQIVDGHGFVIDQNDDARGNDPRIVFNCPRDGRYVVRVFAFPATPNSTIRLAGAEDYVYRLTLTTGAYVDHVVPLTVQRGGKTTVRPLGWNLGDEDAGLPVAIRPGTRTSEIPFGPGDPVPVSVVDHVSVGEVAAVQMPYEIPVTITGHVESSGEVDEFAFRATKGEKLSITVESRALGFPLDAAIDVVDEEGKSLKSADDEKRGEFDPVLAFDAPADGTYRVRVRDVYDQFGPRHAYRLSIVRREPDFELSIAADRFTLATNESVTIPVAVERRNGFAEAITVRVEGLPEGVTCELVESDPADKDTKAKVELKLVATADATASRPIRILGRDEGDRFRVATAPIGSVAEKQTEHSWLTVTQPAPKE